MMNLNTRVFSVFYIFLFLLLPINSILKYNVRMSRFCDRNQTGIFLNTSLSLNDCVRGCTQRSTCGVLEYYRRHTMCLLREQTSRLYQGPNDSLQPCAIVERRDIEPLSVCTCTDNTVCEWTETGHICARKNCEPIDDVNNGKILGNMHDVGSTLTYTCNENYVNNNNDTRITCLKTGQWDIQPKCVVEPKRDEQLEARKRCRGSTVCDEPSIGENVMLSMGNYTGGSLRAYTCNTGYYYGVGTEYVTSVTTECLQETGNWSINGVNCLEGRHIGEECSVFIPCVDAHSLCLESTCFCHAMFQYDNAVGKCVQICTYREDTFYLIGGIRFVGFNDWRITSDDIEECMARCIDIPECFHVEDWTSRKGDPHCNLGRVTFQAMIHTKPELIGRGNGVYIRMCTL